MSDSADKIAKEVHLSGSATLEEAVTEALDGQPGAAYWNELRQALAERLQDAITHRKELPADDPSLPELDARIAELREQVAALANEEAVTEFVEDSLRAALTRPRLPAGWDDEY